MAVTLVCAIVMRIVDGSEFGNIWLSLWWAVQTVTTVGYGDIVPSHVSGRAVASVLMLTGIGFVSVVTASITAAFLETVRRRLGDPAAQELHEKLDELSTRLEAIENALRREDAAQRKPRSPLDVSGGRELRADTRYRRQYEACERYEPPRMVLCVPA